LRATQLSFRPRELTRRLSYGGKEGKGLSEKIINTHLLEKRERREEDWRKWQSLMPNPGPRFIL